MAMHLLREAPVTDTQGATLLLDASARNHSSHQTSNHAGSTVAGSGVLTFHELQQTNLPTGLPASGNLSAEVCTLICNLKDAQCAHVNAGSPAV